MKKKIVLRAFAAELSEDLTATRFFESLSDEQKNEVMDYVARSHDATEAVSRSATALTRLRQGRIDFV
ncbi:MAG: hypothetical protein J6C26_10145 [Clostridia bacterium]|nr:hypothetical protein [Clostridia bacterium]MBQ4323474.1 hypothetical protein [Clostridia bacterium]